MDQPALLCAGDGPAEGRAVAQWGIEIGAPAINVAMGWRKNSVKKGDKVKLDIAPARSGATYGTLRHLTFPDGRDARRRGGAR